MLLHNQRGAAVSWEALGRVYSWEPYGACDVPDNLVPLLKSEGFPVDVCPVPPKEKAERAAAAEAVEAQAVEIEKLGAELASVEAVADEAKRAAEAAESRAAEARATAALTEERARVLSEEVRALKSDVAEYEKMLAEATAENAKLKDKLKVAEASKTQPKRKE